MAWVGLTGAVVLLSAAVGFVSGAETTERSHDLGGWRTADARVGANVVSIDSGGWVYGARGTVPEWIDYAGTWHDSGWPECLQVPPGTTLRVRFAAHKVSVDDQTFRPIVAVDCRVDQPS